MIRPAAIVGAGVMGRWHAHAVRRLGGRVTVVVDPDARRATELASKVGAEPAAELDPAALAALGAVAHVCTPLETHEELVASLLDAGTPALVEKPLTARADATVELVERATAQGVLLCPVHQFAFQAGMRRVVEALWALAPIRHVDFVACTAGAADGDDHARDELVADILPHPLSLFGRVLGCRTAELEWRVTRPQAGELRAVTAAEGADAALLISTRGRPTTNMLRVIGERGTATADLYHGFAIVQRGRVSRARKLTQPFGQATTTLAAASANLGRRAVSREPAYPGLRELVRAFYDAVEQGGPAPVSPAEIVDVAAARDRLLQTM